MFSNDYEKQFELFLRYAYKLALFKKKEWEKLKPVIGFSASLYFQRNKYEPQLSNEFLSARTNQFINFHNGPLAFAVRLGVGYRIK